MKRLINLTPAEKRFLDDAVAAAERASGKKLNQPNRHIVLNRARAQIESQRARQNGSDLRVRRSGSRRNLPGRVRGRRVADCHFRRFCGSSGRNSVVFTRCIVIRHRKLTRAIPGGFLGVRRAFCG